MNTNAVSGAHVKLVRLSKIKVGTRRRQKIGALAGLQRSIDALGLVHPILIRGDGVLVAGRRRLEACRALGWTHIPARCVGRMTDEELRAIELEENTERLDLVDYEASKRRLAEIRQEEAEEKAKGFSQTSAKTSKGGRPRKHPKSTAVSEATVRNLESHVEIAEKFPFMQAWPQYHVLEAGELMEKLPKKEHPGVAVLLDQPGIPSKAAVKILTNLIANVPPEDRLKLYEGSKSDDPERRGSALSIAAALPPSPEPALLVVAEALVQARQLRKRLMKIEEASLVIKVEKAVQLLEEIQTALGGRKVMP